MGSAKGEMAGTPARSQRGRVAALVFSYHNWESRTQGGFHKLTEALCGAGLDVDFVSFPRPYYGVLKCSELVNARVLLKLMRGEHYEVHGRTLWNFTCPTLSLPGPMRRFVPESLFAKLEAATFPSLLKRLRRKRPDYRLIVFESTPCVRLYPQVRRAFPSATVVYRPSDPLRARHATGPDAEGERRLLGEADAVLLINEASRELYAEAFPDLDTTAPRFLVLANGVDVAPFRRSWPRPAGFRDRPVAAYVGFALVCWDTILLCARQMPEVDFHIVTPIPPPRRYRREIRCCTNVFLTPGVPPQDVARYVTNCEVVIVPYLKSAHLRVARLHAKLLQAMVAGKPIVAANLSGELQQYGILVAEGPADFVEKLRIALAAGPRSYAVDFDALSWENIQQRFVSALGLDVPPGDSPGAK